ncbi:helix-turn-helix transcriptional regulator [Caulobacter mirabilis]|uniref:PAS fold-4 domain-containing protein n=1 Tax=Caulobacter mirabilis TaxID=69666 RepID=A0A2D2AXG3_9CAUL|nr:PAS domain-containing protein [Caulobacter mirabilis]ATQ42696.1 hypothetical protein CSW64_09870 [Caulobacter mirabilis]
MTIDLDGIYAAIEDDRAFDQLADHIASACDTRSAIFVGQQPDGTASWLRANYWDRALLAEYQRNFIQADPWTETAVTIGRFGRAAALDQRLPPEDLVDTAIYNDLLRVHGDDTGRCLGVMPPPGREGLIMAIHRAAGDAAFTVADEQRLDEVYGHVRRVVSLRKTLALERDRSARLQDIVDQTGEAILRLDRNLQVIALSAAARRLVDAGDGLSLNRRSLVAPAGVATELRAAVAAVIDRTTLARAALLCHRPSGRRPYRLALLPAGFDGDAGALLRIDDPDRPTPGTDWRRALQDAYGLTTMEADLALRLYAEHSLDEIADLRGVVRETLRTQLKSLFLKTGVNRQSALLKLLATFPMGNQDAD